MIVVISVNIMATGANCMSEFVKFEPMQFLMMITGRHKSGIVDFARNLFVNLSLRNISEKCERDGEAINAAGDCVLERPD